MTTVTHGGFDSPFAGRMIPVGDLLRREGQGSSAQNSQARRALGGVAAGAVLAFSAVVGGLLLHHPNDIGAVTAGGTDAPLGSAPDLAAQNQTVAGASAPGAAADTKIVNGVPVAQLNSSSALAQNTTALPERLSGTLPMDSTVAGSTSSITTPAQTGAVAAAPSAPSSASFVAQPPASPAASTPASTPAPPPSTSKPATPGLLGTVNGVLGDVAPFHWFN